MPTKSDGLIESGTGNRLLFFAGALLVLMAFAFQGSRGLYESTEGRYAECARQSMEQGTLDEPVLNGEPHWSKPPLTYYCIAAGLAVLGNNAWGARIGLAFAFVLTVWAVYRTACLVWGTRAGVFSGIAYGFSAFVPAAASVLTTDTYLALWEALVLWAFWSAIRRQRAVSMALMWLCFGFAFLTKGFPALLCLAAPLAAHVVLRRSGESVPRFFNPIGVVLFLSVGLSWYVVKSVTHHGLLQYWLMDEGVGRNVLGESNRNAQFYKPLTIYGPVLLAGVFPWAGFLLWHVRRIPWPAGRWLRVNTWPFPVEWVFILTGTLLPLGVLCLSTSRMPMYVLPLFAPIALGLGKGLDFLVDRQHLRRRTIAVTMAAVALFVIAFKAGGAYVVDSPRNMEHLARDVKPLLNHYPSHALHVLKQNPMYGLQFYLNQERVDKVRLEDLGQVIGKARAGAPQLCLIAKKFDQQPLDLLSGLPFEVIKVNRAWTLIVLPPIPATTPAAP